MVPGLGKGPLNPKSELLHVPQSSQGWLSSSLNPRAPEGLQKDTCS